MPRLAADRVPRLAPALGPYAAQAPALRPHPLPTQAPLVRRFDAPRTRPAGADASAGVTLPRPFSTPSVTTVCSHRMPSTAPSSPRCCPPRRPLRRPSTPPSLRRRQTPRSPTAPTRTPWRRRPRPRPPPAAGAGPPCCAGSSKSTSPRAPAAATRHFSCSGAHHQAGSAERLPEVSNRCARAVTTEDRAVAAPASALRPKAGSGSPESRRWPCESRAASQGHRDQGPLRLTPEPRAPAFAGRSLRLTPVRLGPQINPGPPRPSPPRPSLRSTPVHAVRLGPASATGARSPATGRSIALPAVAARS